MDSVVCAHAVDPCLQPKPQAHRGLDCSLHKHITFAVVWKSICPRLSRFDADLSFPEILDFIVDVPADVCSLLDPKGSKTRP